MSAFKRYKSKVFWSQMEAQDNLAFQKDEEEEQEEAMSLDDEDSEHENNTTVIHVLTDDGPKSEKKDPTKKEEEPVGSPETDSLAIRSFSPSSRGQRSQDSGFSDSGRSDESDLDGNPTRRSRRASGRRRSSRRRPELPQGPAHTSTPKQDTRPRVAGRGVEELSRQLDFSPEATEEPECLNDFLFEPGADDLDHSSIYPVPSTVAPVRLWLEEVRGDVEDECMATLQSKSLPRRRLRDDEPESRDLRLLTASATTAAKKVIDAAERFDKRYQRTVKSISSPKNGKPDRNLLKSIEDEATEILLKFGVTLPRRIASQADSQNMAMQLGRLKNRVDRAFDQRLDFYIEKVVRGLEEAPRENGSTARGALAALTALGLAGPRAASSIARCLGIRALLTSLISAARLSSELRSCTLRALASCCCCIEAVDQFVREGGPDILVELLADECAPHTEKSEATALLVQITAPWMDYVGLPYLEPFAMDLVGSITDLAVTTSCKQTLLLAAAAINHLAHSRRCIAAIIKCDSIKKLLRCVKKSNGGNVCLMEQVASLIGLVGRVPQAMRHLADTRASVALVCFCRMGVEDEYRKLEATARDSLTRLCVDPEIAKQVVAVGGTNCLPSSECSGRECKAAHQEIDGFRTTQSLRVARKIAAEQIDIARIKDHSPH